MAKWLYFPGDPVRSISWSFAQHVKYGKPGNNYGVDFRMRYDTLLAPAAGKVIRSEKGAGANSGYGQFIMLQHPNGWMTLYAHLSRRDVKVGQTVVLRQKLGKTGESGYTFGAHLHMELIQNGRRYDVAKYMKMQPPPENGGTVPVPPEGIRGNDLSHWNKAIKISDLAAWGSKFCWIKLTQGDWFLDDQADRYYDQCLANGILPSFYHFYEGEPPMDKQVDWFVKHLRNREVYLPVALDFEDTHPTPTLHKYSKKWHTQKVYQFAKSMQFYSGYPEATIYSRKNLWEKYVKTDAADWFKLLQWKANQYNMQPWEDYTVWQYGQRKFNGVNIDTNVWNPAKTFPPEKPGTPPQPPSGYNAIMSVDIDGIIYEGEALLEKKE